MDLNETLTDKTISILRDCELILRLLQSAHYEKAPKRILETLHTISKTTDEMIELVKSGE